MEYQHGGDIYSRHIELDYSANINPLGLPEGVKGELAACLDREVCSLYPDSRCDGLRHALSRHHQVPKEWVVCGNGAADLIFGLACACRPLRALVTAPAFSEYEQAMGIWDCPTDRLFLKEEQGFLPDVEAFEARILGADRQGKPYDMVFLCNPNNPTGIPLPSEEVEKLAAACMHTGTRMVVDECFCDFLDVPERYSIISQLEKYPNLFVLKAFTKLYSMAGLRLGYGLSRDRALLQRLNQVRQPWSVSGLALKAGEAALRELDYVERTRKLMAAERPWLGRELEALGFTVYGSRANYLFFRTGLKEQLGSRLLERKVLIRSCGNYPGLDDSFYRICVKTRKENECLMEHMKAVMAEFKIQQMKVKEGTGQWQDQL